MGLEELHLRRFFRIDFGVQQSLKEIEKFHRESKRGKNFT
jgi:hypothetical protein